ncbi:MAG: lipid-A-disaccharide synthase [Verrucomicrobiales bacterium]|nr:lipid-A-disaccharide synthase [Verrucomicrobiales bacterium]MBP9223581.1 lipid-A-disaccharide synthase [Verrucomicrobiales bacterium]HQZ29477.1 lipid-A-disaccharide synthase [Verrucomicrobiales bacterium]
MKSLFLVSGEISGDTHGAALLAALPEVGQWTFAGLGGPEMNRLAPEVEDWLEEAAVLGLWEVLKKYGYFRRKMEETVSKILTTHPDGVVFIDYPGFNLRLAKRLRKHGYGGKLIYYISPQVWAWKKGRIRSMARLLDLMICIFPFEKELYEASGLRTLFGGHPLVDSLEEIKSRGIERDDKLVALLPGSREREIAKLFPPMLAAAKLLKSRHPELRFATTGATPVLTNRLRELTEEAELSDCVLVGECSSHEIMLRAGTGVIASGTATLEAACLGLPYCLTYKVAWLTAKVATYVMSVPYLGIVNVIAGREVVKELLQERATGETIADALEPLLSSKSARVALQGELAVVVSALGEGGAHLRAAQAVLSAWEEEL